MPPPCGALSVDGAWREFGSLELILGFHWLVRSRGARFFHPDVELRTGLIVGEQWFQGVPSNPSGTEAEDRGLTSTAQVRVPLTVNLVFQLVDDIYGGFGGGPVVSFPWRMKDRSRLEVEAAGMAQAFLGWRAARALAIELAGRGIYPEHVLEYKADLTTGQTPRAEEVTSLVVLFPELRLRVDL